MDWFLYDNGLRHERVNWETKVVLTTELQLELQLQLSKHDSRIKVALTILMPGGVWTNKQRLENVFKTFHDSRIKVALTL